MTIEEIHALLLEQFGDKVVKDIQADGLDGWIEVAADSIVDVGTFLRDHDQTRLEHLNDLCGVDYCEPDEKKAKKFDHEPHLEVVYQLSSLERGHRLRLKVKLERWQNGKSGQLPEVPSVSGVWGIADWHERECYDMFGIQFKDHPNLRRILCPEDWVGYPLRKDYEFPLEYHGVRGR